MLFYLFHCSITLWILIVFLLAIFLYCLEKNDLIVLVRLFLSEDTPSQVGIIPQDHLQPKKKTLLLYNNTGAVPVADHAVPPGFEGVNPETQFLKNKLAQFPLAKWKCPPSFLLDPSWCITAGEGSDEVEIENQRELRVFEAIYPRPSIIPPKFDSVTLANESPAVSLDAENIICDDSRIPVVPISAIEEEDVCEEVTNESGVMASCEYGSASVKNWGLEECGQPQLLAAASAALSAIFNGGSGGLIDHELLLKLLSNPAILEEFMRRRGNPSSGQDVGPASSQPFQIAHNQRSPITSAMRNQMENSSATYSFTPTLKEPFYTPQLNAKSPVTPYHQHPLLLVSAAVALPQPPPPPQPPPKDIGYYKNLIQQHGGDRQQDVTPMCHHGVSVPSSDSVELTKPRFTKPCAYFNSPKGCRHGANCSFMHGEASSLREPVEMHGAKRMKMSGGEMTSSQPFS